jgi:hypothetical protein
MQDMRALKNPRTLASRRAWQDEAFRRSGVVATLVAGSALTTAFVLACALYRRATGPLGASVVLAAWAACAATILGLMALAVLRLRAWERANPWTPPS